MWGTKAHSGINETVCAEVDKGYLLSVKALPPRVIQFVKFCIVGGTGVLVDMTALFLLADPKTLALNVTLSKILAAEAAMLNNFAWNEAWTFKREATPGERHQGWVFRLIKFNVICGIGIILAVVVLNFLYSQLGWNLYVSNLLTIVLVTSWNFGMNVSFTWRRGRKVTSS
jgi:dolichol-phosphate mannosyltransferase